MDKEVHAVHAGGTRRTADAKQKKCYNLITVETWRAMQISLCATERLSN